MKDNIGKTVGVINRSLKIIACSDSNKIGKKIESFDVKYLFSSSSFFLTKDGFTYMILGDKANSNYAVFIEGDDKDSEIYIKLLILTFENVKKYHDEKYDKENFVKNLLFENIVFSDIDSRSLELGFGTGDLRTCFVIRITENPSDFAYRIIRSLFPDKSKDFVIPIDEFDIVLVKKISSSRITKKDLKKLAKSIEDALTNELCIKCLVGIGTIVKGMKNLLKSFKEAKASLEIGKIFDTKKTIMSYDQLGVTKLIYQLPETSCDVFLKEIFKSNSIDLLNKEILFTMQCFFENNLNISETSRELFIHRNTLVYRLNKIKKITGLDVRKFENAVIFKIALMVKKYLSCKTTST
jgi:carbohydrate diacid regulator